MNKDRRPYVCPAELSYSLDNLLRRLVHDPHKILSPYISHGMIILDIGCGPGYFTGELARLTGVNGKVIAADVQEKMLGKMMKKMKDQGTDKNVISHLCRNDSISLQMNVDFVFAFWMVHEVPDHRRFFEELKSLLNPGGRIWIIEPKIHVTGAEFEKMIAKLEDAGLEIIERPKVTLSRTVLVSEI